MLRMERAVKATMVATLGLRNELLRFPRVTTDTRTTLNADPGLVMTLGLWSELHHFPRATADAKALLGPNAVTLGPRSEPPRLPRVATALGTVRIPSNCAMINLKAVKLTSTSVQMTANCVPISLKTVGFALTSAGMTTNNLMISLKTVRFALASLWTNY